MQLRKSRHKSSFTIGYLQLVDTTLLLNFVVVKFHSPSISRKRRMSSAREDSGRREHEQL